MDPFWSAVARESAHKLFARLELEEWFEQLLALSQASVGHFVPGPGEAMAFARGLVALAGARTEPTFFAEVLQAPGVRDMFAREMFSRVWRPVGRE